MVSEEWQDTHNIHVEITPDSKIILTIDGTRTLGLSSTQKTIRVATAGKAPAIELPNGETVFLNMTVYKYPPKEKS